MMGEEQQVDVQQLLNDIATLRQSQAELVSAINSMRERANDPFLNFSIPDPIRNIPTFNGNKKEVNAWVEDAEQTINLYDSYRNQAIYGQIIRAVKNKIIGEAREILIASGNPNTWAEIKEVILNAFGDRRDLPSHIQSLFYVRQGKKTLSEYYNKIKTIDTAIKSAAANMDEYKQHTRVINSFVNLLTLTRFVDGLNEDMSMHVRSCRPESLEHALEVTVQYSNAAYRHKMDRKISNNTNSTPYVKPQTAYNKPGPSRDFDNNKPPSGKFRNKTQSDDVSMRSHTSKMQINNNNLERNELDDEQPDEQEFNRPEKSTNSITLDDEEDEFFRGEEINFHITPGNSQNR